MELKRRLPIQQKTWVEIKEGFLEEVILKKILKVLEVNQMKGIETFPAEG